MRVTKKYQPLQEQGRPVIIFGGRADVRVVAEDRTDVAVDLGSPFWGFGMPRNCVGDYDEMILVACGWWSALLHWGKTITVRVPHGTEVEVRIARRIFTEGPLEPAVIVDQGTLVE
ncbi:hypothetical protein AB0C84_42560 [Actinomadura sp. NPDC048955]|uniref:hypothetical protein n=1 Tax=Actinomadura sp. NPDC048955 TaxID=3158228 RepID=UPI0033E6D4E8